MRGPLWPNSVFWGFVNVIGNLETMLTVINVFDENILIYQTSKSLEAALLKKIKQN